MKTKISYDEIQELLKTHQYFQIKGIIFIKFEDIPYLRIIMRELDGNDYLIVKDSEILCPLIQFLDLCSIKKCCDHRCYRFLGGRDV